MTTATRRPLTRNQKRLYDAIAELMQDGTPSLEEIAAATGKDVRSIYSSLASMRRRGWVTWSYGKHRTLRLLGGET